MISYQNQSIKEQTDKLALIKILKLLMKESLRELKDNKLAKEEWNKRERGLQDDIWASGLSTLCYSVRCTLRTLHAA